MSLLNKVTVAATAAVMLFGTGIASAPAVSAAPATSQGDTGKASSLGGTQIETESEEAGPAQMSAAAKQHAQLLGKPTSEVKCTIKHNGCYQAFAKGALFFSPVTGAQPVVDEMWKQYRANGFEDSSWGYPVDAPVVHEDGSVTQDFQGGRKETAAPAPKPAPGGTAESAPEQSSEPSPKPSTSQAPSESPSKQAPRPKPSTQAPSPSTQAPSPAPKPKTKKKSAPKPKPKAKKKAPKAKKSTNLSEAQLRKNIIKHARNGIGTRYVWGGTSPTKGWDCSGFTQHVYRQNGINIPRVSGAQRSAGKVVKASEAKPGDIIWTPGHVGIVSDKKGKMIDAGSRRTGTSERSYNWMVKRGAKFIRYI